MLKKYREKMIFKYLEQLIFRYKDDDLAGMSAQITYYLILSFFPFLLFLINLLSFTPLSGELLFSNFDNFLPSESSDLIKNIVLETVQAKSRILLIVSMIGSLWVASKGIAAIMKGLNRAYDIKEDRGFIKMRLTAIFSTVGVTILIILSFIMIVFGKTLGIYLFELIGAKNIFNMVWSVLRYCFALIIMFIAFSLIYKYVPNRKLKFSNIKIGTIFATIGWVVISLLFSFYVNNFGSYEKIYGSLGGAIALIIWLNISALIILVGGELNAISSYFKNKEKIEKYDSYKLEIPILDKILKIKIKNRKEK